MRFLLLLCVVGAVQVRRGLRRDVARRGLGACGAALALAGQAGRNAMRGGRLARASTMASAKCQCKNRLVPTIVNLKLYFMCNHEGKHSP